VKVPVARAAGPPVPGRCACSFGRRRLGRCCQPGSSRRPALTYVLAAMGGETYCSTRRRLRVLSRWRRWLERFPSPAERPRAGAMSPRFPSRRRGLGPKCHTPPAGRRRHLPRTGPGLVCTHGDRLREDDFRLGRIQGLNVDNPTCLDGTYDERIGPYAGRFVKEADSDLVETCAPAGAAPRSRIYITPIHLLGAGGTPLLYYAQPAGTSAPRSCGDRLLAGQRYRPWSNQRAHQATGASASG